MKALGLVVSDKKIFENCILKTYFLTLWPTYATNWNGLNNFDRGPPRDHSCEVWSKSNKRFQRRCCLKKFLTDARTDEGCRTLKDHKSSLEHFVLRWAKNQLMIQKLNLSSFYLWTKSYSFVIFLISNRFSHMEKDIYINKGCNFKMYTWTCM